MKLIMENWNRFVNESKDKSLTIAGDAGGQFVQAVKMIQSAMIRHDLAGSGHGTYDPLGTGDPGAAWDHYGDTLEAVFEDKEFQTAKTMLVGLYVITEHNEEFRIMDVKEGSSEHEASSNLYIWLGSPVYGDGIVVEVTWRIGEDSFYYEGVRQVNNEPGAVVEESKTIKLTKTKLRKIIKEEVDFRGSDITLASAGPMMALGAALETAIAKAQIVVGSSKNYQKRVASEIELELERLLEMMWEL